MSASGGKRSRAWWIAGGLAAGIGLAALFLVSRQPPARDEAFIDAPAVSVIEVRPLAFRFEARGHGVARPAQSWQAIANVPGRVVERHPQLESGALLRKGTLLLVLDPSRFELAIAEAEAELASLDAETNQLAVEEDNTARLLELEREQLELAEQELERIERLAAGGTVSHSQRDEQRRATLARRQAVASLSNQLSLIPPRQKRLQARQAQAATRLEQARRDLQDTRFVAPYDLRLGEVDVELHQHAAAGQRLFRADSIEAAEVETHVPLSMLRRLMGSVVRVESPADSLDIGQRLDFAAIQAEVTLTGANNDIRWPARVTRLASGLDPNTRTARVVVTVDEPYRHALPPDRPPLQQGMYVQVRLLAPGPEPLLIIPAAAVHGDEVYVVDDQDRLQRRPVTVAFEQQDLAVIHAGLGPGDRVIIDDPVPALQGMPVKPRRDPAQEQRLQAMARGESP